MRCVWFDWLKRAGVISGIVCVSMPYAFGQNGNGSGNGSSDNNLQQIETEVIIVTPFGASPSEIARPKGKCFLEILNQTWDPTALIAFVPAPTNKDPGDLTGDIDPDGFQKKHRSVGLTDLHSGDYQLLLVSTGAILATITIQ